MKQNDIEAVEKAMDGYRVGYAYLYPSDGGNRQEFVFDMTPENVANFIGGHLEDAEKIVLTDMLDRLILDTVGGFINNCPNQEMCQQVIIHLAPIQLGETLAEEVSMVTRDLFEQYTAMEEAAVMQAEISML